MDVDTFLREIQASADYHDQIVNIQEVPARPAQFAERPVALAAQTREMLKGLGFDQFYSHQAEAIQAIQDGRDILIVTGTASGKSLCYVVPIIEALQAEPDSRSLLLFPTKALCQDQFRGFQAALSAAGQRKVRAGVFDGDTPPATRRKLRDHGTVIFSNPDMLHAVLMPQHARWAKFLAKLKYLVLDELHVYNGMFGANMANLLRRFDRVCKHYGSQPQIISCSATVGNPDELAQKLTGRDMLVIDQDGSPRGRRLYVFWNPPVIRKGVWRSRRSANVEAHEIMADLISRGIPTITFAKAKMTAEMIHRYVCEKLSQIAPHLVKKVTPYRGGYRPEERREIERRLFAGELLGVSATRALELGIDVGALDACVIVGYPGTLASFLQQSGRAGRGDRDSLVVLVGLDTSINQYVMSHPEYLFGRAVEQAVIDRDNPFVVIGHLRCAAHELALPSEEEKRFGPYAGPVLNMLQENQKVQQIDDRWYHTASETPQHEMSLRNTVDASVTIEEVTTGEVLGQVNKLDAPPILHPEAIYFHRGNTYRVLKLDFDKNVATVKREEVDYYTQPLGGTDIHHVDARFREKPFGTGHAYWGEVTAYFNTGGYEKIRFYELDAISQHDVELPTFQLETMAFWLVPPEELTTEVREAGLDAFSGLRAIGYATRMLLPLFVTCDTLDFSHTVGSVNSPWQAIFIYERYRLGLGYTERAYELLDHIMPAVHENIRNCPCEKGCPRCVGKPLRQYATWDVQRGEASIPSKEAALMILDGYLADGGNLDCGDTYSLSDDEQADALKLEQLLRRRLERGREPEVFHPIEPMIETKPPDAEKSEALATPDVAKRTERRRDFERDLRKRLAKRLDLGGLDPLAGGPGPPPGTRRRGSSVWPKAFPSQPVSPAADAAEPEPAPEPAKAPPEPPSETAQPSAGGIQLGDSLASRARKLKKKRKKDPAAPDGERTQE